MIPCPETDGTGDWLWGIEGLVGGVKQRMYLCQVSSYHTYGSDVFDMQRLHATVVEHDRNVYSWGTDVGISEVWMSLVRFCCSQFQRLAYRPG